MGTTPPILIYHHTLGMAMIQLYLKMVEYWSMVDLELRIIV